MKPVRIVLATMALAMACQAWSANTPATPTCNSGPQSGWQSTDALKLLLIRQSIKVTQIKVVGDCWAVYATNKANQPVNYYYHPVTLKPVAPIPN
jgi:hypothetical protein